MDQVKPDSTTDQSRGLTQSDDPSLSLIPVKDFLSDSSLSIISNNSSSSSHPISSKSKVNSISSSICNDSRLIQPFSSSFNLKESLQSPSIFSSSPSIPPPYSPSSPSSSSFSFPSPSSFPTPSSQSSSTHTLPTTKILLIPSAIVPIHTLTTTIVSHSDSKPPEEHLLSTSASIPSVNLPCHPRTFKKKKKMME